MYTKSTTHKIYQASFYRFIWGKPKKNYMSLWEFLLRATMTTNLLFLAYNSYNETINKEKKQDSKYTINGFIFFKVSKPRKQLE